MTCFFGSFSLFCKRPNSLPPMRRLPHMPGTWLHPPFERTALTLHHHHKNPTYCLQGIMYPELFHRYCSPRYFHIGLKSPLTTASKHGSKGPLFPLTRPFFHRCLKTTKGR